MKIFFLVLLGIICINSQNQTGIIYSNLNSDSTFFYKWQASTVNAIDSLMNESNIDSNYRKHLSSSRTFFGEYSIGLRAMEINSLLNQTKEQVLYDLNDNTTCLLEFWSNGYCETYKLYILKQKGRSYSFETLCADREVHKSKKKEYFFDSIRNLIVHFTPKGDEVYGTTGMITFIVNGQFKSYPLFYLDHTEFENLDDQLNLDKLFGK